MLTKIEELEIRVGELVKENHELREAGTRLAKENTDKYFALKKHAECNYKLMKEIEELKKEIKELKNDKEVHISKGGKKLSEISFGGDLIFKKVKGLEPNKWYHTTDFTEEELKELLPIGTNVLVEKEVMYSNIEKEPPVKSTAGKVLEITKGFYNESPLINIGSPFNKEWFKII